MKRETEMNKSSLFDVMSFYLCGKAVNYRFELYKRCIQFFITAFADWCFLQMFHIFELVARSIHATAKFVKYILDENGFFVLITVKFSFNK